MDARIAAARAALGDALVILGHHYQRDEVIRFADYTGDSFKLARADRAGTRRPSSSSSAACTSWPRARTSSALPHQQVILPDLAAGCSMADMAAPDQLEIVLDRTRADGRGVERRAGHLHQLRGGDQSVRRRAGRHRLHLVERRGDARVGVGARRADPVPAGPAPGPQHRLQDGRAARRDGGVGSARAVRRPRRASRSSARG